MYSETLTNEIEEIINNYNMGCTIEEFENKVDWYYISAYQKLQKLSEEFIEKFQDKVNWHSISTYQKLSEEFIEKFQNKVDWHLISEYQKLSEEFIEKFQDKVDWYWISTYQKLSEAFVEKFQDNVHWSWISKFQKLSEAFIENFQYKVNWDWISKYQKLSKGFRNKHNIHIPKNSWLYTSTKKKLEYIKNNTNYEVVDNKYIIAFKGIRSDNYSKYNFQYKYKVGQTYESHCDCNLDVQNSFGLSAWTLEKAKEYCNEKVIKVEIYIKDIGAIVHKGNKIRCFKFKVLEELTNQT